MCVAREASQVLPDKAGSCCCCVFLVSDSGGCVWCACVLCMVVHAKTSVNVSSATDTVTSPFARSSTGSLHISQACSYVVQCPTSKE